MGFPFPSSFFSHLAQGEEEGVLLNHNGLIKGELYLGSFSTKTRNLPGFRISVYTSRYLDICTSLIGLDTSRQTVIYVKKQKLAITALQSTAPVGL